VSRERREGKGWHEDERGGKVVGGKDEEGIVFFPASLSFFFLSLPNMR